MVKGSGRPLHWSRSGTGGAPPGGRARLTGDPRADKVTSRRRCRGGNLNGRELFQPGIQNPEARTGGYTGSKSWSYTLFNHCFTFTKVLKYVKFQCTGWQLTSPPRSTVDDSLSCPPYGSQCDNRHTNTNTYKIQIQTWVSFYDIHGGQFCSFAIWKTNPNRYRHKVLI